MHSIFGYLLLNGSVLCIQIYQVVLSTMVLHFTVLHFESKETLIFTNSVKWMQSPLNFPKFKLGINPTEKKNR